MKNQGITNMQVGPEATLIPPKSPEFILWGSWLYKASSQQIENRWLIRCGPKHGWNLLTGLDKVILHKGILLVMGRGGGGECTPWSRVREQADGHTHSVWSWCWFHSGGGGGGRARKASPHRCSQAAVRGTSTSPLNKDTLSKPENTTIAHLVFFFFFFQNIQSIWWRDILLPSLEHPRLPGVTGCTGGEGVKVEGRKRQFCFSAWTPKLLMDALPKSTHPHTGWNNWCDCMLMFLLVATHYLLSRAKD